MLDSVTLVSTADAEASSGAIASDVLASSGAAVACGTPLEPSDGCLRTENVSHRR